MPRRKKFYCGDKNKIPDEYQRRGSRLECLRKGFGIGNYKKDQELRKKYNLPNEEDDEYYESENEREERFSREEKNDEEDYVDKDEYMDFVNNNFDKALRKAKNLEIGDLFKQMAKLWKMSRKD